jgi:hypothetical protein
MILDIDDLALLPTGTITTGLPGPHPSNPCRYAADSAATVALGRLRIAAAICRSHVGGAEATA